MLFSAGALLAIEQKGLLGEVDSITSVSGSSFLNGKLALAWPNLRTDDRVRWRLEPKVIADVQDMADHTIDVPSILIGASTPFTTNSTFVASAIDRHLTHHASLADLPTPNIGVNPQTPVFSFQATDLATGKPWFFSNQRTRGGAGREFRLLDIPLSQVITASSAFPPIITPVSINFSGPARDGYEIVPNLDGQLVSELAMKLSGYTLSFTDGGVSDNRGMGECIRSGRGLISDAAVFDTVDAKVKTDPISVATRVSDIVYSRAERERTESVIQTSPYQGLANAMMRGMAIDKKEAMEEAPYYDKMLQEPIIFGYKEFDSLLYWAEIRKSVSFLDQKNISLTDDATYLLDHLDSALCHAMVPTRLKKLDRDTQNNIINMGYLSALSAIELKLWSANYKKYWVDYADTPQWKGSAFPVLMFKPPRHAQEVLERLGTCENQQWVSAYVDSVKQRMAPLSAALKGARPSELLPIAIRINDDEISDQLKKDFQDAFEGLIDSEGGQEVESGNE